MRTSRLLLAPILTAAIIAAGCFGGQANPLGPSGSAQDNSVNQPQVESSVLGLLGGKKFGVCTPLPAQTKSANIGILGGVIKIGPHTLTILPAALLKQTAITATIVAGDKTNSVQFFPAGLKFKTAALLSISYANCEHSDWSLLRQMAYTSDDLRQILELLPSVDIPVTKTVVGTIQHFSRYAVAY